MNPLRIGIDARPLSHPFTGIGRYTEAILSRMCACPHEIYLYTAEPLEADYDVAHVRTHGQTTSKFGSTLTAQMQFPKWQRQDQLDVFWSPRHHLPLRVSCPSVVTVHDLVWRAVPDTMAPFGRFVERLLMAPSLAMATRVIAVSKSTHNDVLAWKPHLRDKLSVVTEAPCVTRNDLRSHKAELPERFLLFVGTFEPRKNLVRLIRAFAEAAPHIPHHLILAGGKGWDKGIDQALEDIGDSAERVHRIHPDQGVDLAELYDRCEAFVYPSLYEGFGLPLTEAMAFGKPIVTGTNSSLPEVAQDAAIYVDVNSTADIADSIKRICSDASLRTTLSAAAQRRAAAFSWDTAAAQTINVLETAASSSSPTR